jgi:menaquinol-cytochrome c reductase iron-sulfur subunit
MSFRRYDHGIVFVCRGIKLAKEKRKEIVIDVERKYSRRLFLEIIGKGSILVAFLAQIYGSIKAFIPSVLYEPPSKFKIGKPDDFPIGTTFLPENKLYIFRKGNDYRAISAMCTHLNCIADWKQDKNQFYCSCHGSVFSQNGNNIAGPAPKPLSWHPLSLAFDSHLVVDTDKRVSQNYKLTL